MDSTTLNDILPTLPWLRLVHYLISRSDSRHVAHCLDLDVVATGASQEAAVEKLDDLVKAHIEVALATGQLENLSTKAPNSYWRQFIDGVRIEVPHKTLHIRIPEAVQVLPLENSEVGILAHRAA
jgi:hypothetical protein